MPRVLVIAGMGRSGTSLAASLLRTAGVDVGDRFVDAAGANPRGFFEDTDFVEFHERALKERGRINLVDKEFAFEPTEAEEDWGNRLVAARSDRPLWGFKDPRASLFLDFWDARFDDAVYLFLFRHPFDVLMSYLRYGEARATGFTEPVRAWETYNARILEFRARHTQRCALVHAYGMHATDRLNEALQQKLRLDLSVTPEMVAEHYRPTELHVGDAWAHRSFAVIEPEAAQLYSDLLSVADVIAPEPVATDEPEELATYRRLVQELLPSLGSHRRGVLLTLVELVAPEIAERAITSQREWTLQLEEAKEWLDEQRLGWMQRAEALERRPVRTLLTQLARRLPRRG
jgi:hypothetical protein